MMTMLSGEINHALHRMNTDTRETLKKVQDSYVAIKHLVNSASSSQINLIQAQLDRKSAALNLLGQQLDEAGRSDAAVFQTTLRYVDIGDDSQADSGQDHGLVHGDVYTIEVSSANRWLGKAHQDRSEERRVGKEGVSTCRLWW